MHHHETLAKRAEQLRALHHASEPLLLPNAWDAGSAKVIVAAGFPVVATTSGGMADSLGWADGERTPPDQVFAALARIARVVDAPVTADLEAGYGLAPSDLVAGMLDAGAVGCNLEDTDHRTPGGLRDAHRQAEWLADVKHAAHAAGVDIVLNARVDVFLRQVGPPDGRVAEALERARLYLAAGADCIYPIGVSDEPTIRALVEGIDGPVNIWARADGLPLPHLAELGVARISFATALYRAMLVDLQRRLTAIQQRQPW